MNRAAQLLEFGNHHRRANLQICKVTMVDSDGYSHWCSEGKSTVELDEKPIVCFGLSV